MDEELQKIKDQIIASVLKREGELLQVQDKIQAIIDDAAQEFAAQSIDLEKKYFADPNGTTEGYKSEYRRLGEKIKAETQRKIDDFLRDLGQGVPAASV